MMKAGTGAGLDEGPMSTLEGKQNKNKKGLALEFQIPAMCWSAEFWLKIFDLDP